MIDRLLPAATEGTRPVHPVREGALDMLPERAKSWAAETGFKGGAGSVLVVPGADGRLESALLGLGRDGGDPAQDALLTGALARDLPLGDWHLETGSAPALDPDLAGLAFLLGGYRFER